MSWNRKLIYCGAVWALSLVGVLSAGARAMAERINDEARPTERLSKANEETARLGGGSALLWDNGGFVNGIGTGCDGLDSSSLEGADTSLGWSTMIGDFRLADDFVVPEGETWTVSEIVWRVYQPGAAPTDQITTAAITIYDGDPSLSGGIVMTNPNIPATSTFSGAYRDVGDAGCDRAIKNISIDAAWVPPLVGGTTYWIEVSTEGNEAFSGPWALPTTPGTPATDNGLSFEEASGLYTRLEDTGSLDSQDFPFVLFGTGGGIPSPDLVLNGSCPGPLDITITGGTPGGQAAILFSPGMGNAVIPGGPCAGTTSGLASVGLLTVLPLDGGGGGGLTANAPASACGQFLQILDASNCTVSNVSQIP